MIKEPRINSGERAIPSVSVAGTSMCKCLAETNIIL